MKRYFKRFVLPLLTVRRFQPFYQLLHRVALVGMNMGPVGEVETSGERRFVRKLLRHAPTGAVVFDVGANVGEYSIVCADAFVSAGKVIAFEPSKTTYGELQRCVAARAKASRIEMRNFGFSDREGFMQLNVSAGYSGNASVYTRHQNHLIQLAVAEQIELRTMDDFVESEGIDRIFLLKVDVEGQEFACLKGAQRIIGQGKVDYIQFEFGGCDIESRVFFRDFWELLSPRYRVYRMLQNSLLHLPDYHELHEIFTTTNFVAVRKDLRASRICG